ncbi:MAG: hypothetical protein QF903_12340 [Planctomycetota bacterium]|nr:hypothetical protein [Planctomycetota bacterium]MDP6990249.1 hypothetical protein [Planctomycetota bacterium]
MTEPTPDAGEVSPFCSELRTKKLVFATRPPRSAEELMDASGHCWCGLTMQTLGPDGEVVDPQDCRAPRACNRPYLGGGAPGARG